MSLASEVAEARRARHLSQTALALAVHASIPTISLLESGQRIPSHELCQRLEVVLELPSGYLCALRGEVKDLAESVTEPAVMANGNRVPPALSVRATPNIPEPSSSFIGRVVELGELRTMLVMHRLITLTGPGGVGKTRLAIRSARENREQFCCRVWFIPLADAVDADFAINRIVSIVRRETPANHQSLEALDGCFDEKSLLVLDNCEHIVQQCAQLVEALLSAHPHLTILATSRERLALASEIVQQVPPMSRQDAVELFIERAKAVQRAVPCELIANDTVAAICHNLDRNPLAIEMAASRTQLLSLKEILANIRDVMFNWASINRTVPARHQTLRASFESSYNLLSTNEQRCLRYLSIFMGPFTLDAAKAICRQALGSAFPSDHFNSGLFDDPAELLLQLVQKSLVQAEWSGSEIRFRLLELVRQFAAEKLKLSGEEVLAKKCLLEFVLALVESIHLDIQDGSNSSALDSVAADVRSAYAALDWSLQDAALRTKALRIAVALAEFHCRRDDMDATWNWIGSVFEEVNKKASRKHCDGGEAVLHEIENKARFYSAVHAFKAAKYKDAKQLLERWRRVGVFDGDLRLKASAAVLLGRLFCRSGDHSRAEVEIGQGLDLAIQVSDAYTTCVAYEKRAEVAYFRADYNEAMRLFTEALIRARELEQPWERLVCLSFMGRIELRQADLQRARTLCDTAFRAAEKMKAKRIIGDALDTLSIVDQLENRPRLALNRCLKALTSRIEAVDKHGFAESMDAWSFIVARQGNARSAATFIGMANTLRRQLGSPRPPADIVYYEEACQLSRTTLGTKYVAFERASESWCYERMCQRAKEELHIARALTPTDEDEVSRAVVVRTIPQNAAALAPV